MRKLVLIVVCVVLLALIGGGIFLASSTIPAPSQKIEKPIPDDKMPK